MESVKLFCLCHYRKAVALADLAKIHRTHLSLIERGQRGLLDVDGAVDYGGLVPTWDPVPLEWEVDAETSPLMATAWALPAGWTASKPSGIRVA